MHENFDIEKSPIRCDIIRYPSRDKPYFIYFEVYPDGTKVHRYSDLFFREITKADRPYTMFRYGAKHNWFMLKNYMIEGRD